MAYTRVNWQDSPSTATPISASNLNKMDKGIKDLEDSLATVATTGDYDDLIDTPNLSTVATSGSYNDLTNKPQDHLVNIGTSVDSSYNTNLLSSKNMLKLPNIASTTTTTGLTYSVSNGVLTINGTASANTTIVLTSDLSINIPDKTAYRISVNKTGTTTATGSNLQFLLRDSSNTILGYVNNIASASQTSNSFQNAGLVNNAIFVITSGVQLTDAQFTFQVEKGTSATDYQPFTEKSIYVNNDKFTETIGIGTSVNSANRVNVLKSNNLLPKLGTKTIAGLTATEQSDGSLILNGTVANSNFSYYYCGDDTNYLHFKPFENGGTFTISCNEATGYYIYIMSGGSVIASLTNGESTTFTVQPNQTYRIFIRVSIGTTLNNIHIYPMLNKGSEALPYEPYITPSIVVDNEMLVSKNVYSTGEVVIGEWFGKPLYRKVIEITNPTLDAWATVNHNISNMDYGRIEDANITRTIYGTTSYIPIGVSNISAGTLFTCDLQKTIFEYKIASYTNITKLTAVLEYTKTTD